jgi:hypothetical protein
MKCAGCRSSIDATNVNAIGLIVCPHCGRAHEQSAAMNDASGGGTPENPFREQSSFREESSDIPSFAINPYASPSSSPSRAKKPPRKLDNNLLLGIGCLAGGIVLTIIGVNFLFFGSGVMPFFVVGGGPILLMVGLIYLFFWFTD